MRNPLGPPWVFHITIEEFLDKRGVPVHVRKQYRATLGRLAKRRFMQINNRTEPPQVAERHGNWIFRVHAYREADLPMLDEVWEDLMRRRHITW